MKNKPQPQNSIKQDLLFWIKQYISSKILTVSIDKGFQKTYNRNKMSDRVLDSKDIKELDGITKHISTNGQKAVRGNYSIPLIEFYKKAIKNKRLKQLTDFNATIRDAMYVVNKDGKTSKTRKGYLLQVNALFKHIEKNNTEKHTFELGRTRGGRKTVSLILDDGDDGVSYLTERELRLFLKELNKYPFRVKNKNKPILMMKIATFAGLRAEELASIKRDAVDIIESPIPSLKGKYLRIYIQGKGNKERVIHIAYNNIKEEYESYSRDAKDCTSGYLFCTEANKKYTVNAIYDQTKRLLEYAGLDKGKFGIHLLRRSYASYLALRYDFAIVSTLLGHASEEITELYVKIGQEGLRPIADEWVDF